MIQGVDVSKWQSSMDWQQAKAAGVKFAIIKCSDGASYKDPKFAEFYDGACEADIQVGAYHFFRANATAGAQYANIKAAVSMRILDLPIVLDVELFDGVEPALATSRLQELVSLLLGYADYSYPMIYTSAGLWNPHILAWSGWRLCPLWVANWGVVTPKLPRDWTDYYIWQYSSVGTGSEYGAGSRYIDLNKWNEAHPFPGTTPIPEPEPEQVMGYMQVLVNGKLYRGTAELEEDTST